MVYRYIDDDTADVLMGLFLLLIAAWVVITVWLNLPKAIGSLIWSGLGKFPFNVGTILILWLGGYKLLKVIFRPFLRISDKRAKENS